MYGASKLICINRFLWVAFQLDAICAEVSDKGIERALERVPDTMDATYERILDTIKAKSRAQYELARRIIIWIVYARRPLSIDELALFISIETDTEDLEDLRSSIPTEESILDACANLISVDQSRSRDRRYVRFVHFSVQEFFTSHRSTTLNMGQEVGHREITQTCIIFLTLFPEPSNTEIHSYAFQEWPRHLLAGNIDRLQVDDSIVTLTLSFFEKSPMILTKQSNDLFRQKPTIYFKFSPLVLALIFDLLPTQKYTGKKLESKAIYYIDLNWTLFPNDKLAIHYAIAELDSIPVVQRLYNHGYMLNYSHPVGWNCEVKIPKWLRVSPLYSVKSTKMLKHLLDNGINVDPRALYFDPFKRFAQEENWDFFQLLLDRIVDQDDRRLNNALQGTARIGKIQGIQLLLDKGADANAQSGKYGSALQAAALSGSIGAVQLLLDKGADVNAQGGIFGTVLQAAAYHGNIEVIQLLLDKGADVNAQGGIFGTILQAAAYRGNIEVIQLFLDNGADIYSRGGEYGATLGKMLALEPVGSSQKVPECKILLAEFLQYHKPILMKDITDSELDYSIRACSNKDRCNLDVFRELLESRGWRREGPSQPSTSAEKSGPRSVTPSPLCKQNKRKSSAMEDHSQAQLTCVRCGKEGHVKRPCRHDTNRCDRCGQSVHRASYVHRPKHSMVLEEVTEDQDPCQAAEMQEQTEHHSDPGSQDMDEEMSDDMVI